MAMSTQEAKAMLAREEAATGGGRISERELEAFRRASGGGRISERELEAFRRATGGARDYGRPIETGVGPAQAQIDQELKTLTTMAAAAAAGQLSAQDLSAFNQIISGLPPEVRDSILSQGQGAAPVQSQNFGALAGATGTAPSSGEVNLGASQTNLGATVSNTGGELTPKEEALMTQFTNDMLAREGLVRGKRPIR